MQFQRGGGGNSNKKLSNELKDSKKSSYLNYEDVSPLTQHDQTINRHSETLAKESQNKESVIIESNKLDSIIIQGEQQIGYHFHVLTDFLSKETQEKITALANELNKIYPCKFSIYTINSQEFQGLPKLNNNYLAYFRLKLASVLPQNITKCLYLDVDMLCLSDIREIFSINLENYVLGAVLDADFRESRVVPHIHENKDGKPLNIHTYFNTGMLLINLEEWKRKNIEQKCFDFLANYKPLYHDQDTLNAILSDEVKILPLPWNFMVGHLETRKHYGYLHFANEHNKTIIYTKEEYEHAKKQIKILHYLTKNTKPWHAHIIDENLQIIPRAYRNIWWEHALATPVFHDELQNLYLQTHEEIIMKLGTTTLNILEKQTQEIKLIRRPHKLFLNFLKKLFNKGKSKK